jgi:hypothetical protein
VKRKNTQVRKDLEEFSEGIDDIVREAVQRGEVLPVAVKRPYNANNSVIDEAIEWCANKHKKQISRTRAQKLG